MVKPSTRLPNAAAPIAAAPVDLPAPLTPAPDNGVPFAERPSEAAPSPVIKRRGTQLGARIPSELHQRLVACADSTRIPQGRLIERALDAELKSHGY